MIQMIKKERGTSLQWRRIMFPARYGLKCYIWVCFYVRLRISVTKIECDALLELTSDKLTDWLIDLRLCRQCIFFLFILPVASSPNRAQAVPLLRFLDHTRPAELRCTNDQLVAKVATYTTRNKHKRRPSTALSGIRTHDPSNRSAADIRLRQHRHRDKFTQRLAN